MHSSFPRLLLAAVLCCLQVLLLTACTSCSARHEERESSLTENGGGEQSAPAAQPVRRDPAFRQEVEVLPPQTSLSPAAEITAAYLTFLQAMNHGDEEAALAAAEILAGGRGEDALPPVLWQEGAVWFLERKSVNAIPFLKTARTAAPGDLHLMLLYSEALSDSHFDKEALACLDEWLASHPGTAEALVQKGITLYRAGRLKEAVAAFESVRKSESTSYAEFYHARALLSLGRPAQALQHARASAKLSSDFGEAVALQAFLAEKTGELREARGCYERLLGFSYAPKDIYLSLIRISLKLNKPSEALDYFRQGPSDDTDFQLGAAAFFTEFRHYLQASRILKGLIQRPDPPEDAFLFLADLTYRQQHDLKSALAWLDRIPDQSDAAHRKLILTAQLQSEAGLNEEALATLRQGRVTFPSVAEICLTEARLLASLDRKEEALAVASEGAGHWPESVELSFTLGTLLAETGKRAEAMAIMEKIVVKDPGNYLALNYVGYTLASENRDLDRALTLLNRANSLAPDKSYILDSLAWAHFKAGHLDEAWKYILEAARLDERGDPEIFEHYGDIADRKGLHPEAREAWRKALERNPPDPEALRRKLGVAPDEKKP